MDYYDTVMLGTADVCDLAADMFRLRETLPPSMRLEGEKVCAALCDAAVLADNFAERVRREADEKSGRTIADARLRCSFANHPARDARPDVDWDGECDLSEPMRPLPDANSGA